MSLFILIVLKAKPSGQSANEQAVSVQHTSGRLCQQRCKFAALYRYQVLVRNCRYYWWGCNFFAVWAFAFCALVRAVCRSTLGTVIYDFNNIINRMERTEPTFARYLLNRSGASPPVIQPLKIMELLVFGPVPCNSFNRIV